ncbi:putative toxin-antitoxin system toxin component, PIN family [Paucibacter sp. Y2R2-4]|uniref:PIN domain-containing protein n=1 Tax=Paucibacter sp. Y2R2-4 TaxID=2893553 RepID=UPI0021E3942D|nr:PIN domain-containing protein [Paucibacter sp. Y2R2-4]MCV2350355.1 PIN domain-containing protein [Paucibacter sp. Y2R2-4]
MTRSVVRNKKSALASAQKTPRVALDTDVLLRALLGSDRLAQSLRQSWQAGQCQPVIAAEGAQLLIKTLGFPNFALDASQQRELLADFLPYAEAVKAESQARQMVLAAPVLRLAKAAGADILVSECATVRRAFEKSRLGACQLLSSAEFLAALSTP